MKKDPDLMRKGPDLLKKGLDSMKRARLNYIGQQKSFIQHKKLRIKLSIYFKKEKKSRN